jgi:YbgC/YbaW family acyl-CoA thioester hydrolase
MMVIQTAQRPKVLESKATIRFQDCDPFNHLNNARYIDYFLNAREDQVKEHYGLDIYQHALTTGAGWVVGRNQLAYFKPAKLMEEVVIESQLIQYGRRDITVELRMLNTDRTQLKAFMWANFVHFRLATGKSEEHSAHLLNMFEDVLSRLDSQTFDERFQQLVAR